MRLLLYVLAAWFVLSIPAALFFGLGGHPKPAINRHLKTGN
jgi:hypothetical protein